MSSVADQYSFQESVDEQDNTPLFQDKKWTYITDSSSISGNFSGQVQFDLNTLSSQNQWTDLSEAVIQVPIKLSIQNTSGTFTGNAVSALAACLKNGTYQFCDSLQIVIGGNTVQSSQIFTNILTNYRVLSTFSGDTYHKYGDTIGLGLDDYLGTVDTAIGVTDSLDNSPLVLALQGFDITNNKNSGFKKRQLMNNNDVLSSNLGKSILGTNQARLGKSNVQIGSATAAAGNDIFVMYLIGSIRLKDISDFASKAPMCKGLKGYIYLNYNTSTHILTNAGSSTITAITNSASYGRCAPAQLNYGNDGFIFGTGAGTVTFKAEVSAVKSANLTTADTIMSNARLICPYFVGNPSIDRTLSQKSQFRYEESFVTQFSIDKNGSYNGTITPGISNPKRIILYPYFTGPGDSGNDGFVSNPLISPFDGVPSTTSPFAALKELQVYVGNRPIYQSPISYDYDNWLQENSLQGVDGGLNKEVSSGLLSQRQWNQLYRYYTVDIGRRMDSEDGASKSIQVSLTNATTCPMTVVAIVLYEREVVFDTVSGMIQQVR